MAIPRPLTAENTCSSRRGPGEGWSNYQVDFNTDGQSGTLSRCNGDSLISSDVSAAPSCSKGSFAYIENVSGIPQKRTSQFVYQIIPIPSNLSVGAIVGIAIGALAACVIVGFFCYRYYRQLQSPASAHLALAGGDSRVGSASDVRNEPMSGAYVQMPITI